MAHMDGGHEERLRPWKERLLTPLTGDVLEIGAGAGANLRYLAPDVRYVAVEPNLHMHRYLRREADRLGVGLQIHPATGEALPVADRAFDAVVTTLVLCSVQDVSAVMTEVQRVLRPGGRFVFVEHVAARPGSRQRRVQRLVRPLWKRVGDGCEPDRELAAEIRAAGFDEVRIEAFETGIPVAGPHIAGMARVAVSPRSESLPAPA
jgi:SAM-dependent methyltransferase